MRFRVILNALSWKLDIDANEFKNYVKKTKWSRYLPSVQSDTDHTQASESQP